MIVKRAHVQNQPLAPQQLLHRQPLQPQMDDRCASKIIQRRELNHQRHLDLRMRRSLRLMKLHQCVPDPFVVDLRMLCEKLIVIAPGMHGEKEPHCYGSYQAR